MYELKLSEQDVQIVLIALSELKLKDTINTFITIKSQVESKKKENELSEK